VTNRDTAALRSYHDATKHSVMSVSHNRHGLDWDIMPRPFKIYPDLEPLALGKLLTQRRVESSTAYWVYVPPLANKAAAETRAAVLRAAGVKDLFVVDSGRDRFAISLGNYRTEEAADAYVAELAAKNLVVRHRGKGTFVSHADRPVPIVAPLGYNAESLGDLGRGTLLTVLFKRMAVPPPDLQAAFGLGAGARVCQLVRVRSSSGQPFAHYVSWTPKFSASMPKKELEGASRLTLFERYGLKIAYVVFAIGFLAVIAFAIKVLPLALRP